MTDETVIAMASAGAAVIAAFFAWRSAAIAKSTLKLARIDHDEKHEHIRPYLIDGALWENEKGEQLVSFACSFTNGANAPTTITRMELHVHAYDGAGNLSQIILDPIAGSAPSAWDLKKLSIPLNLQSRTTESGWMTFCLPEHIVTNRRIDKYALSSITSSGEKATMEAYILRRMVNGN